MIAGPSGFSITSQHAGPERVDKKNVSRTYKIDKKIEEKIRACVPRAKRRSRALFWARAIFRPSSDAFDSWGPGDLTVRGKWGGWW